MAFVNNLWGVMSLEDDTVEDVTPGTGANETPDTTDEVVVAENQTANLITTTEEAISHTEDLMDTQEKNEEVIEAATNPEEGSDPVTEEVIQEQINESQEALNDALLLLGGKDVRNEFRNSILPSLESSKTPLELLTVSNEGIGSFLATVWEKIKKLFIRLGVFLNNLFLKTQAWFIGRASALKSLKDFFGKATFSKEKYETYLKAHMELSSINAADSVIYLAKIVGDSKLLEKVRKGIETIPNILKNLGTDYINVMSQFKNNSILGNLIKKFNLEGHIDISGGLSNVSSAIGEAQDHAKEFAKNTKREDFQASILSQFSKTADALLGGWISINPTIPVDIMKELKFVKMISADDIGGGQFRVIGVDAKGENKEIIYQDPDFSPRLLTEVVSKTDAINKVLISGLANAAILAATKYPSAVKSVLDMFSKGVKNIDDAEKKVLNDLSKNGNGSFSGLALIVRRYYMGAYKMSAGMAYGALALYRKAISFVTKLLTFCKQFYTLDK